MNPTPTQAAVLAHYAPMAADATAERRADLQAQLEKAVAAVDVQDAFGNYAEATRYHRARMEVLRLQGMLDYLDRVPA